MESVEAVCEQIPVVHRQYHQTSITTPDLLSIANDDTVQICLLGLRTQATTVGLLPTQDA